jgi:class 3 adenylate cyclase
MASHEAFSYMKYRRIVLIVFLSLGVVCSDTYISSKCLNLNLTHEKRYLIYPDKTAHNVSIPYPAWTSGRIIAQVSQIIVSEVMNYSAELYARDTLYDSFFVADVIGCQDFIGYGMCSKINEMNPNVHFTLETWEGGTQWESALPDANRPTLLNVLDYAGDDTFYLWPQVIDDGLISPSRIVLNHYHSYNASLNKPSEFFDPWTRIFDLIPNDLLVPCSGLTPFGDQFITDRYISLTNDTGGCDYNGHAWFSPACRHNRSECVPTLIQYSPDVITQLAYFLNMPLAVVMVNQGQHNYREYIKAVQNGRFLFTFWTPDDRLVDSAGRLPEELIFPKSNQQEQAAGIFKTGTSHQKLRNYGWRHLDKVDRQIKYFASRIDLFQFDMDAMMVHSRQLKQSGVANDDTAPWLVACAWVRANADRWRQWVPRFCPAGEALDPTLTSCVSCPAGAFCTGEYDPVMPCPLGFYCPANATAPSPCLAGRTTVREGAASSNECDACATGKLYFPGSGTCVPAAVGLPAILVPLCIVIIVLAVLLAQWWTSKPTRGWHIRPEDIEYPDSETVLGRGSQGVVLKAYRRGTPVAVKCFFLKERASALEGRSEGKVAGWYGGRATRRQLLSWVQAMGDLRHPCITTVMGVVEDKAGSLLVVVLEFMELGSLADLLQNKMFCYDAEFVMQTLCNVSRGMRYLHEARPPVVHGDLRAGNVLIDKYFCAKISDIGLISLSQQSQDFNSVWTAPECLGVGPAKRTLMSDVYAYGVLLYTCLTRRLPGQDGDEGLGTSASLDYIEASDEQRVVAPAECSVEVASLLNNCVGQDPALRPTFDEVDRRLSAMGSFLLQTSAMEVSTACPPSRQRRWNAAGVAGSFTLRRTSSQSLLNTLPRKVIDAMARGEKVAPEPKEMVTMFFSDIVGYTSICAALPVDKVSGLLDRLYDSLDAAAQLHGVTKIETIGDAYLCVANLSGADAADHAARMARFSLAALRAAANTPIDEDDPARGCLQIRVGLNSGPCTAGVVGRQCPKYTLFGDTINVAARMEQSGEPGRVHCTLRTADLVRAQDSSIVVVPRGIVEIKGKGSMETFWILPEVDTSALENPVCALLRELGESRAQTAELAVGDEGK